MKYSLYFPPFLIAEIIVSVVFVALFGFGTFFIFLLCSMLGGAVLLAIFWRNVLEFRVSSPSEMLSNFAFVIAGFLLVIPGVLSTICALFVLIFALVFGVRREKFTPRNDESGEIIDVEIIEDRK